MTPESRAERVVNVVSVSSSDAGLGIAAVAAVHGVMFGDVWMIAPGGKEDAERCCASIRILFAYAIARAEDRGRSEKSEAAPMAPMKEIDTIDTTPFGKDLTVQMLARVAEINPSREALTLAAQLLGVPVCEGCDYIKSGCRCPAR